MQDRTASLKIIAYVNDVPCLNARFDHSDAPSRRFGLLPPVIGPIATGAIYRRYCVFPYQADMTELGHARLLDELASHEEARLLALNPGEFFGLQIGAWRHANGIVVDNIQPMPYWMQLIGYAGYKAERARSSGNCEMAADLLKAASMLRARYEGSRVLHTARLLRLTVH